jgi:biopolymer transport protein TolR
MKHHKGPKKRPMSDINVVPYIDVMLVLLVIFMITTPLLTQGVQVTLPKTKANAIEQKNQTPMIITVDKQGLYYLNTATEPNTPMTARALVTLVSSSVDMAKQAGVTRQVLIRGDNAVDYGKVVAAMALLQQAGVENIGLITETPPTLQDKP